MLFSPCLLHICSKSFLTKNISKCWKRLVQLSVHMTIFLKKNKTTLVLITHCECFRPGYVMDIPATGLPAMNRPMKMPWWNITARVLFSRWKTGASTWEEKKQSWLIWFDSRLLTCVSSPPGRFEQAFINSLLSESGANSSTHYWMGLMEAEDSKEYRWLTSVSNMPLTFTNWNKHQPGALVLLCLLMRSEHASTPNSRFFFLQYLLQNVLFHPFL